MKIFIALGGLLVLLLSAVLIAPLFVDWTAYRADFEREASRILGQPVRVLGEAEARLLPFPSLTFTDVAVGPADAEPVMTLAGFRMDAELAPYLSGEIRIFQMSLDAPHLRVDIGDGEGAAGLPTLPGAAGSTVVLENVVITNGRISLRNSETGRSRDFTGIDAAIAAQTLSGPFTGNGQLVAGGEAMSFSLSSGRIEESGRWPLRLTLGSERLGLDTVLDGATTLGDGEPDFTGTMTLASRAAPEGTVAPLPPLRLQSAIEMSRRQARLAEVRAEVGSVDDPYVLTGEGTFEIAELPHFDLALRGEQVNVDDLARPAGAPEVSAEPLTFAERAEAVRATLTAIPRIDIPGRVELALPIVTAGDTTIRDLTFSGSPTDAGWTIRSLRAEFPGRTLLEASGLLDIRERFSFSGDVLLAARQPPLLATWLTGEAPPALANLTRAGFSARVRASAEAIEMEGLEVDVGGQQLTGRLSREAAAGGQGALSADLSGAAVDLDAFLSFARLFTDGSDAIAASDSLDIRFEAGPVAYDGLSADTVGLDFSFADDFLDLRNLIAEGIAGTDIEARGFVAGLADKPTPELAMEIASDDPRRFLSALQARWPSLPLEAFAARAGTLAPLALSATASAAPDAPVGAVVVAIAGTAGGTVVSGTGTVEAGHLVFAEGGSYEVAATLRNEVPGQLLDQFGATGVDLGLAGPLAVTLRATGDGSGPVRIEAETEAAGTKASATGTLEPSSRALDLALAASSEDAAPWLTAWGIALGQDFDGLPVDLTADLASNGTDWRIDALTGTVAGTSLSGSLASPSGGSVTGALAFGEISLPWLATLAFGIPPDLGGDDGLWPAEPFAAPLLPRRGFAVEASAESVPLGKGNALSDARFRLEGGDGRLRVADLDATFGEGRIGGSLELANIAGFGSVKAALSGETLTLEAAPVLGTLAGRLEAEGSGRTYRELVASLTGGGEVRLADARLPGVAPGRLSAILAASDVEGFTADTPSVEALVRGESANAVTPLGDLVVPVAISVGVARTVPIDRALEAGKLTASASLDLRTGAAAGNLEIAFLPGEDDRIADTAPSISYTLSPDGESWRLAAVEPLVSFLSLRAYQREQERLEALREDLRETVRLRREARLYRSREAARETERQAALEAERLEREATLEEQRRLAAEREAAAEAERLEAERAAEAARQAAEAARRAMEEAPLRSAPAVPTPSFEFEPLAPPSQGLDGLPGVQVPGL